MGRTTVDLTDMIHEAEQRISEDENCFCCGKKLTLDDFIIVAHPKEIFVEFKCSECNYDEHGDYWNIKGPRDRERGIR